MMNIGVAELLILGVLFLLLLLLLLAVGAAVFVAVRRANRPRD
ncbi:hypothetical protein [Nonomuraea gerenzanensis]|uniref:Uncharacterized protein n=1 Tax=Nonomuraea gerenzanensis TaxID=93944 RepID=A0A1M4EC09_9ACTN|nr:hypothetical protein [Nonomuraea gerenzanensis]SBO96477.1 hypothetical protein BN4615_P5993 [Nonomuraea gerenzanensis]